MAIRIENVVKKYGKGAGSVTALADVSLDIHDNEFFTLLGPSGCGKTTLLRIVAGFEEVTAGALFLYGEAIDRLPPNERPINTVFQHYALFPHMTVFENVAFAPRRLGQNAAQVRRRVGEVLALVQLSELAERYPNQLSGGQQQRVALARALAPRPKVLLLDEPLSALDLKLRQAMRVELKQLQQSTGITFIFVTHDQDEALAMSDRIAVISAGVVQQIGAPADIYERPQNRFVADFIGDTNLLPVTVTAIESDGHIVGQTVSGESLVCGAKGDVAVGQQAHALIRPERIAICPPADRAGSESIACTVTRLIYLGTDTQYVVALADGSEVIVRRQNDHGGISGLAPGAAGALRIDRGAARLLDD